MNDRHQKGKELESVVRAIEETILNSIPSLQKKTFHIESNKTLKVDGVHHEIDLYVEAEAAKGYGSIYIFECKNLASPVGKNDVIILSSKVNDICAQRGFLVAKSFSKDAVAQAKKDPRIELINATQDFVSPLDKTNWLMVCHSIELVELQVTERNKAPHPNPQELDFKGVTFQQNGMQVRLEDLIVEEINKDILEERRSEKKRFQLPGAHPRKSSFVLEFTPPNELFIDNLDIQYLNIFFSYTILVANFKVTTKYEIEKRGRVHTWNAKDLPHPKTDISIEAVQLI